MKILGIAAEDGIEFVPVESDTEPILSKNNMLIIWKRTTDNQLFLLFKRGEGDQVKILFT